MATGCADLCDSQALYSVAQVRAIETAAISSAGPGVLMQRAGAAVARHALTLLPEINTNPHVLVAAGPGNNGGDALEAAALLVQHGIKITIIHL
ncbi:MAG: bifunctional ADP-dependent NAD(P)H-hydrate dehydratase/NAD(P)H-hydrate epimerase, partial [Betaproteobacteria bacterium]|nr:bifunctional ADP-dependent NAD(P)H-hydrate dehydratase/NAD(P)H-hydrate epimerase [Betaproteobacteria bacterium]